MTWPNPNHGWFVVRRLWIAHLNNLYIKLEVCDQFTNYEDAYGNTIVRSLSVHATKTLVQAFISCCRDYCNSLLYGMSDGLRRLQLLQNAAARLVSGACWRDHIIRPVLQQLHWPPVWQRMVFKVAGLVHQSLAEVTPAYLADDCCRMPAVARCGRIPMNCGIYLCRTHTANWVTEASQSPVPATTTTTAGTVIWHFQTISETNLFGDRSA